MGKKILLWEKVRELITEDNYGINNCPKTLGKNLYGEQTQRICDVIGFSGQQRVEAHGLVADFGCFFVGKLLMFLVTGVALNT